MNEPHTEVAAAASAVLNFGSWKEHRDRNKRVFAPLWLIYCDGD
ncbi:hypothetical protein [Nostoc sp.]